MTRVTIKPVQLLYDIRREASAILDVPFTEKIVHPAFAEHKKTMAFWALFCAERVLPYFEEAYPDDRRPRAALEALKDWIATGEFRMKTIRSASLSAHAAAKERPEKDAVFAAHAAGQAVATTHAATHAFGSSLYAVRAVAARSGDTKAGLDEMSIQIEYLRTCAEQNRMP